MDFYLLVFDRSLQLFLPHYSLVPALSPPPQIHYSHITVHYNLSEIQLKMKYTT
jgi:hypothetical protein